MNPLSTLLSRVLVAFTIELDNEFEHRFLAAGGGARVASLVMWSNVLRFVGDGIAVSELPAATGLEKARVLSLLGGLERWRYVTVGPASKSKREGWGSGRGIRSDWIVRLTPAGRKAAALWPPLFGEIERRWEERFGADAIGELRSSLSTIADRIDVQLPEYLPIVGSADGMVAGISPPERQATSDSPLPLTALLSQVLLAYTLDFERESKLSLPLSANVVRVLGEKGELVRDLPSAAGVSKEAIAMALTVLTKNGYVAVDGTTAATKRVRLTAKGRKEQAGQDRLHAEVEKGWRRRFGADEVRRLPSSLQRRPARRSLPRARAAPRRLAREQVLRGANRSVGRGPERGLAALSDGASPRWLAGRELEGLMRNSGNVLGLRRYGGPAQRMIRRCLDDDSYSP
jgi:DNA-binding MarR family transcriptional regulator